MLDKLQQLEDRYEELGRLISDPEVISNQSEWQKHAKAHAALTDVVTVFVTTKKPWQKSRKIRSSWMRSWRTTSASWWKWIWKS